MDIEKLIEQLRKSADFEDYPIVASFAAIIEKKYLRDAATALSTLRAENAQLRVELEYEQEHANAYYEECGQWEAENEKLRAELDRVKAERDAAIDCCSGYCATCRFVKDCAKHDMNDAAPIRWYYGDYEDWEWCGQKED